MAVAWNQVQRYFEQALAQAGRIERADLVDMAFATNANDDVIDTLDTIGSRVFFSVDDAHSFLRSQQAVED